MKTNVSSPTPRAAPQIAAVLDGFATGQMLCYDADGREIACAGSGQDAEFMIGRAWPVPRFDLQGELVLDRLTGLVWPQHAGLGEFPLTWREALEFVAGMNRARRFGFADWRLPNRRELRSLISHQSRRPALPAGHPFREVFAGWYWSSTTAAISPAHAWYVDLDGGRMFYGGKDQSYMVWPVRGRSDVLAVTGQANCFDDRGEVVHCAGSGQDAEFAAGVAWPVPRFTPRGDAVHDHLTGREWRRDASLGAAITWPEALAAIGRLGGGWRLPNINELESLVDCAAHRLALPPGHPFRNVGDVCWSSTTSVYEPDWAWALYVEKGAVGVGQKRQARFHVWAVR